MTRTLAPVYAEFLCCYLASSYDVIGEGAVAIKDSLFSQSEKKRTERRGDEKGGHEGEIKGVMFPSNKVRSSASNSLNLMFIALQKNSPSQRIAHFFFSDKEIDSSNYKTPSVSIHRFKN